MPVEAMLALAKTNRWSELEKEWLSQIERSDTQAADLLNVIDATVKAGKGELADTMSWAWLSTLKEGRSPAETLKLGRELLLRLSDGNELREEILSLYRQTHSDRPDLDKWIDRSGLKAGKSVRRALRYLDVGLQLGKGAHLIHRTDEHAAVVEEVDFEADHVNLRMGRKACEYPIATVADEFDVVDENDFRVLQQLHSDRIPQLLQAEPVKLAIGILHCHRNKMNRDALKLLLVPKYLSAGQWSDWWSKLRSAVKKSPHLRIEGKSPMFLIYDEVGRTLEEEAWDAFSASQAPRDWLDLLEGYLRDVRQRGAQPDAGFLDRVQKALVANLDRFKRHKEPALALATALVIERLVADGLNISTDAHGMAVSMLAAAQNPVAVVAALPDARLWSLAVACVEQAFPEKWPKMLAELVLYAPAAMCDTLAKKVEKAGQGSLLISVVDRALADPGRHTDAVMWLWKGPDTATALPTPPRTEFLSLILALVGPARLSEGKAAGQTVIEMRARVRAGLSAKDYAKYREVLDALEDSMAQAMRRLIERSEGLGPTLQEDMTNMLRTRFPELYTKPVVALWDDDSVLYFTPAGLKTKESELVELVNVKMKANAKAIGEAASHGDLSENSEYKFALEERDLLRARVAKLNREISMARLLERGDIPSDHVSIGQRITLKPSAGAGQPVVIAIMGYDESDITNRVYSYHSPLAREVLGKRRGEVVPMKMDDFDGQFEIDRIESALA